MLLGRPVIVTILLGAAVLASAFVGRTAAIMLLGGVALIVIIMGALSSETEVDTQKPAWHRLVEGKGISFTVLTIIAVLIGGIAEIVPSVIAGGEKLRSTSNRPYSALELEGRDVLLKEGCYNCHSQMIRPFTWETARYGEVSAEDDSIFDHPFQWGSKRTGPDLARVGGKYGNLWHYKHMLDPREISPGSNMPSYAHLATTHIDFGGTAEKLRAMRSVGVPYKPEQIAGAKAEATQLASALAGALKTEGGVDVAPDSELIALISYLQRLGRVPSGAPEQPGATPIEVATSATAPSAAGE